jgi:seryl-tRNA synthetase
MIDLKTIRESTDRVREGARRKRAAVDFDRILALDDERKALTRQWEEMRARQKALGKDIPRLQGAEREKVVAETQALAASLKAVEPRLAQVEQDLQALLVRVPNPPDPEVPDGPDESGNVETRKWGEPPRFDFEPKDHVALGLALDILDFEHAAKVAGSRTYYLKNEGVLLELGLMRLALDHMTRKGYSPLLPPYLVRYDAMLGTAYFPGGEEQAYRTEKDELYLIGTAEVPVTAFHSGEILSHKDLPRRYAGFSACFRREAGAAGKDTKGLYRVHQFHKVEQVVVCEADEATSRREHAGILENAEEILRLLGMPYRVLDVCTGDLGLGQAAKFDLEVWMPSRKAYGETHSASRSYDFQARRLNLRYRDADGETRFCHTLNNTVIASPRALIPLLELNQRKDGSVAIPEALRPYVGGIDALRPKRTP